jgi:hypothetical protein
MTSYFILIKVFKTFRYILFLEARHAGVKVKIRYFTVHPTFNIFANFIPIQFFCLKIRICNKINIEREFVILSPVGRRQFMPAFRHFNCDLCGNPDLDPEDQLLFWPPRSGSFHLTKVLSRLISGLHN